MIIALVIAGIYGQDLREAHSAGEPADSRWVFAEVVAGLSTITAIVYLVPMVKSVKFFAWDAVLLYVFPTTALTLEFIVFGDSIANVVGIVYSGSFYLVSSGKCISQRTVRGLLGARA